MLILSSVETHAFIINALGMIYKYRNVYFLPDSALRKRLEALAKLKGCEELAPWIKSIINHLYWCASSSQGNGLEMEHKWISVLHHIVSIHQGHGELFPVCLHPMPLPDRIWLEEGELTITFYLYINSSLKFTFDLLLCFDPKK